MQVQRSGDRPELREHPQGLHAAREGGQVRPAPAPPAEQTLPLSLLACEMQDSGTRPLGQHLS